MTWRVRIDHDFLRDGIAISMGRRYQDGMAVVKSVELVLHQQDAALLVEPALRIDDELGRALLDALALHYGGTVDARTSREDMLAERKRADKLIDAVIAIARRESA